jgi:hypothetical protein
MIKIISVHYEKGRSYNHMTKFKWLNTESNKTGIINLTEIIEYIKNNPDIFFVDYKGVTSEVVIINANPPHIRTKADGIVNNNLLELPEF